MHSGDRQTSTSDSVALDLLCNALSAGTGVAKVPPPDLQSRDDAIWKAIIDIAADGKLLGLARAGFSSLGIAMPQSFTAAALADRREALAINAVNLTAIGSVVGALEMGDIPFVLFKGPLQQKLLYGDHFLRRSTDIDILVEYRDFDRAGEALRGAGYMLPETCDTPWWRHFLGEQHYFKEARQGSAVDLHHLVQQPGSPAPRHLAEFLENAEMVKTASGRVPMMTRPSATLLCAISLVKALVRREPAAVYVCDFAVSVLAMAKAEREGLARMAARQGLSNSLHFAIDCARLLLNMGPLEGLPRAVPLPSIKEDQVVPMLLTPRNSEIDWPGLRRILWDLCDSSGFGGRIGTYCRESINQVAAKAFQRLYDRQHRLRPQMVHVAT